MNPFISAAIDEAKIGLAEQGIPIGSVLVRRGDIIGRGHNRRVQDNNPIMHAELDCLVSAGRVGNYSDTELYSTLMPCYLCAGAVIQFKIRKVFAGESQNFSGARSLMEAHGIEVIDLDLEECKDLLASFIKSHSSVWLEDIGCK